MRKDDYYKRTMHTPDDPERAALRQALRELSRALLPWHRALIEASRAEYHATVAPVSGPNHLLQLLGDDPFFAWLKPLTAAIVSIDEMARVDFEKSEAEEVARRVQRLVGNGAEAEFTARYVPLLQRDVDVAIGHAAVRQALGKILP